MPEMAGRTVTGIVVFSFFSTTAGWSRPAQGIAEPGPGEGPVAGGRPRGDPQGRRRLVGRQACKEPELDEVRAGLVPLLQDPQRLVEGEQLAVRGAVGQV